MTKHSYNRLKIINLIFVFEYNIASDIVLWMNLLQILWILQILFAFRLSLILTYCFHVSVTTDAVTIFHILTTFYQDFMAAILEDKLHFAKKSWRIYSHVKIIGYLLTFLWQWHAKFFTYNITTLGWMQRCSQCKDHKWNER